jgi:hypothetical protein
MKQRLMNIGQRRSGGQGTYATPSTQGRTGRPTHVSVWRTETDQRLVLDAIRLGVVRTGLGRQPWGPKGQYPTRKALFVAVERAKQAGAEPTQENVATAQAVADRWAAGNG